MQYLRKPAFLHLLFISCLSIGCGDSAVIAGDTETPDDSQADGGDVGGDAGGDAGDDVATGGDVTPVPEEIPLLSPCTFDGAAMQAVSSSGAIGEVVSGVNGDSGSGWLLVTDHDGNVRRYLDPGGEPCTLQLDMGFGVEGILDLPDRVVSLAVDAQDTIYVGYFGGIGRVIDGVVDGSCGRSADTLAVTADGLTTIGSWVANPTRFTFSTDSCLFESWPADSSLVGVNVVEIIGDQVLVAGTEAVGSTARPIIAHDLTGTPLFWLSIDSPLASERLCEAGAITACPAGICVLDVGCPKIIKFDTGGMRVAVVELVTPFEDPTTPVSVVVGDDGFGYLTAAAETSPGQFEGRIYRLDAR